MATFRTRKEMESLGGAADPYAPAVPFSRRFETVLPYLLLAPSLILLVVMFAWPMVEALLLSVQASDGNFTLEHLRRMTSDVNFVSAVRSTLLVILIAVPLQFVLAIIMGLLIQAKLRGTSFFLYLWTIPLAISDLAAGLVWLAIFADRGFLNSILQGLGILGRPFAFLSYEQPVALLLAVVVAELWRATSIVMVIVVAGLQLIPPDYLEAAEVFGANQWQRIWKVMLPLIRSSLQVALILRTILAFQVFAVVIALAGRAMTVLTAEAYLWYDQNRNANVAAAYAMLILAISLITTAVYLRTLRVREEEFTRMNNQPSLSRSLTRSGQYLLALAITVFLAAPIYLIAMAAFSPSDAIYAYPKSIIPQSLSTESMLFFLNASGVKQSLVNSIIVGVMTLVIALLVGAPAGYSLARFFFRGRDAYKMLILTTRAFPVVILAIPLAVNFIRWGLYDTLLGVSLVHAAMALPTTVLVTSSIFLGVSQELEEAAQTLGCNRFQAFLRVVMPLALPGLAAAAIFTFVLSWNEVFAATILTQRNRTLPALVLSQVASAGAPLPFRFAGGFFLVAPALVYIFFMRRYLLGMWGQVVK